jgi:hypothetical protein
MKSNCRFCAFLKAGNLNFDPLKFKINSVLLEALYVYTIPIPYKILQDEMPFVSFKAKLKATTCTFLISRGVPPQI